METLRLFIALRLSTDIENRLSHLQQELRVLDAARAVRWVEPANMHLTLRFLGDTPLSAAPGLAAALGAGLAGQVSLDLGLAGAGGFPNLVRPRVIWVGLQGEMAGLSALQARIEAVLRTSGWRPEDRAFQPHLTVGRVRMPGRPLDPRFVTAIQNLNAGDGKSRLRQVALIRSHLGAPGPRYEVVEQWELDPERRPTVTERDSTDRGRESC